MNIATALNHATPQAVARALATGVYARHGMAGLTAARDAFLAEVQAIQHNEGTAATTSPKPRNVIL